MDRIRMDARIEARMLKTDQPITAAQKAALIDDIKDYRKAHGKGGAPMTWDKLGRHVGVAGSQLSRVCSGSYDADPEPILRKIDEFLAREEKSGRRVNIREFVVNKLVEDMLAHVNLAVERRTIGVICAENGDGKTEFAKWFEEQHEAAILITATPTNCDRRFIIHAIHAKLQDMGSRRFKNKKVGDSSDGSLTALCRTPREKERWIIDYLTSHTNVIVLIDEAQNLVLDGLEQARSFHDLSDSGGQRKVPFILFGDQDFYKGVRNAQGGGRQPFSKQMLGRMFPFYFAEIDSIETDEEGDPSADIVFTRADIERIVKQSRLRLFRPEAIAFAVKLANLHGRSRLRMAVRALEMALDLKKGPQATLQDMKNALSFCMPKSEAKMIVQAIELEKTEPRAATAAAG